MNNEISNRNFSNVLEDFYKESIKKLSQFADRPSEFPASTLYHYTSYSSAIHIIKSKQIWLTDYRHLEDTSEVKYAWENFEILLDATLFNYCKQNKGIQLYFWNIFKKLFIECLARSYTMIASFCEEYDYLSAWRFYADDAKGIALGFSPNMFIPVPQAEPSAIMVPVLSLKVHYEITPELKELITDVFVKTHDILENSSGEATFFTELASRVMSAIMPLLAKIKRHNFKSEKEHRLVETILPEQLKSLKERFFWQPRLTENIPVINSVPRLKYAFQKNHLKQIVVGPRCNFEHTKAELSKLLEENGYGVDHIEFKKSDIPYKNKFYL